MIGDNIITHADAYWVGAIAVLAAAAKCMPKPGSSFSWLTIYTWVYDTTQAIIPYRVIANLATEAQAV
jgi:hypothetical protein